MKRHFFLKIPTGLLFSLPALIYMVVLMCYPIFYNIYLGFTNMDIMNFRTQSADWIGIQNYRHLFSNGILLPVIANTLTYTVVCIIAQFLFGMLLALFFNVKRPPAVTFRGMLVVTWMVPVTVVALVWKFMLSTDIGIVNIVLMNLGIIDTPVQWLVNMKTSLWGTIIANCWIGIPVIMIMLSAGLTSISETLYEAAAIDGCGYWKRFYYITLPLMRPTIFSTMILGFISTFKVFDLIYVMTNGGPSFSSEVLSTYSYKLSFVQYHFGEGAAVANVLFVCLLLVGFFYLYLTGKDDVGV